MTYANPYPASLDVFGNKTDNVSTVLASSVNIAQIAVAALEAKVGKDGSGDSYSFDYTIGNFWTEQTRKMYFYMSTPPTGWSTSGLATNCVVGLKGGTGVWDVVGSTFYKDATWQITDQNYNLHNHKWYVYDSSTYPYHWTYDSDGTTLLTFVDEATVQTFCVGVVSKVANYVNTDGDRNYCAASTLWVTKDQHNHILTDTWRPYAACGLVAKYVGA